MLVSPVLKHQCLPAGQTMLTHLCIRTQFSDCGDGSELSVGFPTRQRIHRNEFMLLYVG